MGLHEPYGMTDYKTHMGAFKGKKNNGSTESSDNNPGIYGSWYMRNLAIISFEHTGFFSKWHWGNGSL